MKKYIMITILMCLALFDFGQSIYNSQQIGQTGRNQNVSRGFWVKADTALFNSLIWIPANGGYGKLLTSDANGFATWRDLGGDDTIHQPLRLDSLFLANIPTINVGIGGTIVRDSTTGQIGLGCADDCYWKTTGNSGTSPSTNFIGTTDNVPLVFKKNNNKLMSLGFYGVPQLSNAILMYDTVGNLLFKANADGTGSPFVSFGDLDGVFNNSRIDFSDGSQLLHLLNASIRISDGTQGAGKVLTSDADGLASWGITAFTPLDSVSIYAITPTNGTTYFCTDCTGSGVTGRIVSFFGAAWRRLKFD